MSDLESEIKAVLQEQRTATMHLASRMVGNVLWQSKLYDETHDFVQGAIYAQKSLARMLLDVAEGRIALESVREYYAGTER